LAQNLVPNPSFEAFPDYAPELCNCGPLSNSWGAPYPPDFLTPPWYSPTSGSPDCFKPCANDMQPHYGVPANIFGNQLPRTGIGYAFTCCLFDSVFCNNNPYYKDYREYLQVKLADSLLSGKNYYAEFFVSNPDSLRYATDRIGLYFSDTAIWLPWMDFHVLNFQPQIENSEGNYICDKENWTRVSGIYTAHGGEKFITIGNFYSDENSKYMDCNASLLNNVDLGFYIDDVSVTLIPEPKDEIPVYVPNIFSPNHDGNNDVLLVRSEEVKVLDFIIYNRWGEKIFESRDIAQGWDGTFRGRPCEEGLYTYYVNVVFENGKQTSRKGNVTLFK
jgi:gliding motility-associated-like protein